MTLSKEDVTKIAHLARLAIDEKDVSEYAQNLSHILELVEQMNNVDTKNVEPMAHPLEHTQKLREDIVTETDLREHYQSCAPEVEEGLYLVPKVLE